MVMVGVKEFVGEGVSRRTPVEEDTVALGSGVDGGENEAKEGVTVASTPGEGVEGRVGREVGEEVERAEAVISAESVAEWVL